MEVPQLSEVASADVDLVRRHVLGGPGDRRVSGQVSIGRSEAVLLRPGSPWLEAEPAKTLIRDEDKYLYHLVMITCTFRTGPEPVIRARLSVALSPEPNDGSGEPVVWAMDPLRTSAPATARRTVRIGVNLKFVTAEMTRETPGLDHVIAEGEGERQVEWAFVAPALAGVYRLSLVARTPVGSACRADLALAATRRETRLGVVPYRAEIPPRVATIRLTGP
jgi:hypothetical protein